jgi:mannose-1-phosphate guanylyltransferase
VSEITQAFVLAAGLGKRLRPLTDELPKPLIPIFQKPLITFALDHLISVGVNRFVINTHLHPQVFQNFFAAREYAGFPVTLVHEPDLLETGGGIKNVEALLRSGPFLTYSGDILADIDIQCLIDEHFRRDNDVTLALRHTGLASAVAFRDQRVVDIANRYGVPGNFDFANIAVWNPSIFDRIPPNKKMSFIPILADWIGQGGRLGGVIVDGGKWCNISSRAEYLEVHRTILRDNWKPGFIRTREWPEPIANTATVDSTAQLRGCTVVGQRCRVGAEAILEETILWPDVEIASQSDLKACIVRSRKKVSGVHCNSDI